MNWKILILLLLPILGKAQDNRKIKNFSLFKNISLAGKYSNSRGLLTTFVWQDSLTKNSKTSLVLTLNSAAFEVFQTEIKLKNSDSLTKISIPYRKIELEEGGHYVEAVLKNKATQKILFIKRFKFNQPRVFDLFIQLKKATVEPDSGYNPIGVNQHIADPYWLLSVGNEQHKSLTAVNSFELIPKKITTTITKYDEVLVGIFDADVHRQKLLATFKIPNTKGELEAIFEDKLNSKAIKYSLLEVAKLERKAVSSDFQLHENYIYGGVKGLKLTFEYGLPYHYRRKNIVIEIKNSENQFIKNCLEIKGERQQIKNRIVGQYQYFIPYHSLQKNGVVHLKLRANKTTIQQYYIDSLEIPNMVDEVTISQKTAYQQNGVSGILYRLDYQLRELQKSVQLSLSFPSLSPSSLAGLRYWSSTAVDKVLSGNNGIIPRLEQQTIFIFLPYYLAPKQIHLQPQLMLKSIDVPTIKIATFVSEPYQRPKELSDISIKSNKTTDYNYTGLAGVYWEFNTVVPEYYHSKGHFLIEILEDGKKMQKGFFIDANSYGELQQKIKNQKKITVFIPYRAMKSGKKYSVSLQAFSKNYAISESRLQTYNNAIFALSEFKIYIQNIKSKEWQKVICKIGIRNFKNINRTYPYLGYTTVVVDTLAARGVVKTPKAYTLMVHPQDEILIWLNGENKSDNSAELITISIAALMENNNELKLKNQANLKQFVLKLVAK